MKNAAVISEMIAINIKHRGENCWQCPQLLTARFGTIYECRIYSKSLGGSGEDALSVDEDGLILRHKQCIKGKQL